MADMPAKTSTHDNEHPGGELMSDPSSVSSSSSSSRHKSGCFSLAIHGGAGQINQETLVRAPYVTSLYKVLMEGYSILFAGGSSLDCVTHCVCALEDDPLFNAGKGSVFTADGRHELDASIMCGNGRRAGCVGSVSRVKNPILLARAVMEKTSHVLFVGEGADRLAEKMAADDKRIELVQQSYFSVKERWDALQTWRKQRGMTELTSDNNTKYGTVGAVCMDQYGELSVATSTGGLTGKTAGRVGDTAQLGAGSWADERACAVSATGQGEFFMRSGLSKEISDYLLYHESPFTLEQCVTTVFEHSLVTLGANGLGGVIVVDKHGSLCLHYNTKGMFRAWITQDNQAHVAIFDREEPLPDRDTQSSTSTGQG